MTDYPLWECQNPSCYARVRKGSPRIIEKGILGPGSRVPKKCPECGMEHVICVDDSGQGYYQIKARERAGTAGYCTN